MKKMGIIDRYNNEKRKEIDRLREAAGGIPSNDGDSSQSQPVSLLENPSIESTQRHYLARKLGMSMVGLLVLSSCGAMIAKAGSDNDPASTSISQDNYYRDLTEKNKKDIEALKESNQTPAKTVTQPPLKPVTVTKTINSRPSTKTVALPPPAPRTVYQTLTETVRVPAPSPVTVTKEVTVPGPTVIIRETVTVHDSGGNSQTRTHSESATQSSTDTPSRSKTPTSSATPAPSESSTPIPTATNAVPVPSGSETASPSPTSTDVETHTETVTVTASPTRSSRSSATHTRAPEIEKGAAKGYFYTKGDQIIDPDGNPFLIFGANIGTELNFWGDGSGNAIGHAKDAKEWGWNTVRPNFLVTTTVPDSYASKKGKEALYNEAQKLIEEYSSQKILVMLSTHDLLMTIKEKGVGIDNATLGEVNDFIVELTRRNLDNPYFAVNSHNEPYWGGSNGGNEGYVALGKDTIDKVRKTGFKGLVVFDAMNMGADAGWDGADRAYKHGVELDAYDPMHNVVMSNHNYGALDSPDKIESYDNFMDTAKGTSLDGKPEEGIPWIFGEFGWTQDPAKALNSQESNKNAADAVFETYRKLGVGVLWWHATHSSVDGFSLKSNDGSFWEGGNGNNLTEPGKKLWEQGQIMKLQSVESKKSESSSGTPSSVNK